METHDATAGDQPDPSVDKSLILDDLDEKFAAFQAFRKSDSEAAENILGSLGAQDDVDRDILLELSSRRPLGHPDRFPEAHALAVRALEVLDRNGARGVKVRGLGPISPIAAFLVQQVAHFIVRGYQSSVADNMLRLYSRREANCALNDPARPMLMRARIHMERLTPGFKRSLLGVPAFLLGGAVLSTLVNLLQRLITSALDSRWTQILATVILGLLIAAVAWLILRGAAVARRRIQLTMDGPLTGLYETIGRCGKPPRDPSRIFALIAIILAFAPWVIIPLGIVLAGALGG